MKNIDIIGACCDLGDHVDGANLGPEILEASINKENIHEIINVKPKAITKEKELENKKKNLKWINEYNARLYGTVLNSLNNHMVPLTLGGDHCIAIASTLASAKKNGRLGIIWFDAHGDYHTFKTTISGNIHGLPLAAITYYEKELLTDFHGGEYYPPQNTVVLGARDIDLPDEMNNLKDAGVTIITTEDIRKYGMDAMYQKAFGIASNGTNGIHVSYDLDCIDPEIAPGVSVPAVNGVNIEEAYGFVDYIIKNKNIIKSMDVVEFNPTRDINHKTEKIANHIINKIIENW